MDYQKLKIQFHVFTDDEGRREDYPETLGDEQAISINAALDAAARLQTACDEFERWMVEEVDVQFSAKQQLAIRGKQKDSLVAAAMEGALIHALEQFRALRSSAETTETGTP